MTKSIAILAALATWSLSSAALSAERCHQIDAGAYSFALETDAVPAVYAEGYHDLVMNRVWTRLTHRQFRSEPAGLFEQLKSAFQPRFVTLIDPAAYPGSFLRNGALNRVLANPHLVLVYVYDGNQRVARTHPHHRAVKRVLETMVSQGELIEFVENPAVDTSAPITGCD